MSRHNLLDGSDNNYFEIKSRQHPHRENKIVIIMYADTKLHILMDSDESTAHPGI